MDEIKNDDALSQEEIWDIVTFANGINSLYPAVFTPQLVNSRLKDLTLTNGTVITDESVMAALNNPKNSEQQLLAISEALEVSSTSYRRILQYMSNLPAWDLTYYCKNVKKAEEYKSDKYQKDLAIVKDFLEKFDYRREFATVVKQMFREETFFSIFRDDGQKYVLQQLPSDYCLITGKWDYSPVLFSFNYVFFQQGGTDMDLWPPIVKETYAKLFIDSGKQRVYNPHIDVDLRGNSTWVMYGDCSPADGFWGWKLSPEIGSRIPAYAGLFPDFAMQNLIRGLQKNSYMASAAKIILGEIALLNKEQKATVKDSFSISPDLLGKFLQLIKMSVNNDAIRVAAAPLTNMSTVDFKSDNDIYSTWLHTTLGSAGINSNLLFSGDVKPNSTETTLSANVDEIISTGIYPYFNSFLEYQLGKRTRYYKFGFNFEGSNFYLDRQRRLDAQTTLIPFGIVNPQKIAAALGQSPFAFQSQLDEARVNGWVDNLTPIVSSFNAPAGGKDAGAPKKSDSKISDEGAETRSSGGNIGRGGKPE